MLPCRLIALCLFALSPFLLANQARANNAVVQPTALLEHRIETLETVTNTRLEANEKLIQSKVDLVQAKVEQANAILQNLENGRALVSNWLSLIGVLLAVMSLFAIFIPLFLQRKQKQVFDAELARVKDDFSEFRTFQAESRESIRRGLEDIKVAEKEVRSCLAVTKEAAAKTVALSDEAERAKNTPATDSSKQLGAAAEVLRKVKDSPIAKLSAKAYELAKIEDWPGAAARWRSLTDLDPESETHWFNLGYAEQKMARSVKGEEALRHWNMAVNAYSEALRVKPDFSEALNNWGVTLGDQARTKSGAEADELFRLAVEKLAEAARIKPDDHEHLNNWAVSLGHRAKTKSGAEADELFRQAEEKFADALRIKPDYHNALRNWGSLLLGWAKTKSGKEADDLFSKAIVTLQRGEECSRGSGSYNLACAYSLLKQEELALDYLELAHSCATLPDKSHLDSDTDLDNVRHCERFTALVNSLERHQEPIVPRGSE